jgi:hypothetical protein
MLMDHPTTELIPGLSALDTTARVRGLRNMALLAGFVLAAGALHLALAAGYANPIPYSDEWIAIINDVLRRSANGDLSVWDLFKPHNEHTMAPTRVLALFALWLNHGQFDNVPVTMFNALLYAGAMAFPISLFYRHAAGPERLFAVLLGLVALAPIEGEDLIFGFQNQYYFMLAGTTATLWLAAASVSGTASALVGFIAVALLASVSMGSGFFAAGVAACICALRQRSEPQHRRALRLHMLIGAGIVLLGVVMVLHAFAIMKASGILGDRHLDLDGIRRIFSCLAWPYGSTAWLGLLLSLPFAGFAARLLSQRRTAAPLDWFALGIGLWTAAQIGALAYSRHSEATTLASRYLPVMLFWPAMNVYAFFRLGGAGAYRLHRPTAKAALTVLPILAAGAFISNVAKIVPASLSAMSIASEQHQLQAEHVARYVRLSERDALYAAGHMGVPYPNIDILRSLLDDPAVRSGLPGNVRAPLAMSAAADAPTEFVPFGAYPTTPRRDDLPGFGSFAAAGNATIGRFSSQPLYTEFPFVRIDLAGYLPDPGLALRLDCPQPYTCSAVAIHPVEFARESWRGIYAAVPQQQFRVVAEDKTPTLWMAFSAPVEVGRLSVLADALVNNLRTNAPALIALLCGALTLLLLLGIWRPDASEMQGTEG